MRTLRQGRGYYFEIKLVADFTDGNYDDRWEARRLGGASSGLPDVLITNNARSLLYSVECKSATTKDPNDKNGKLAVIPPIQIQRCEDMLNMFSIYKYKYVLFAFKFSQKKPKTAKYYFMRIKLLHNVKSVTMTHEGIVRYTPMDKNKDVKVDFDLLFSTDEIKNDTKYKPERGCDGTCNCNWHD